MTGNGATTLPEKLDEVWMFKCKDSIEGAPAIVGNVVYVASMDKHLYALDLATGQQKWKVQLGSMKASPAVNKGHVYVGDLEGKFYAVDAATGAKVWTFETSGEIQAGDRQEAAREAGVLYLGQELGDQLLVKLLEAFAAIVHSTLSAETSSGGACAFP